MKKRYVIVGLGSRSKMFSQAILKDYKDEAELVGLCDINMTRIEWHNRNFQEKYGISPIKAYHAADFDKMIAEQKPDKVIITTMDRTHHRYICRAMELGCDVITEKPLTTDAEKLNQIYKTKEKTGRDLTVTFNYRYSPRNTKVKELLHAGEIGDVISVHFEWLLNTRHGADYFRRWHRDKNNSGGLMVHKSTHHFDLVNWWLDDYPVEVFGMGRLAFYGRENAELRGETKFYERCHGSEFAKDDPFALNMEDKGEMQGLYLDAEHEDGYIRDQSVFGHNISIEDTMSVMVKYNKKTVMTYALNAYCPWEGYRVSFNGTKGRLEIEIVESGYVSSSKFDENNPDFNMITDQKPDELSEKITLQKLWEKPQNITWDEGAGGHGGGDLKLMRDVIQGPGDDPLKTAAGSLDGAKSILVGCAANESFKRGMPVIIDELFPLSEYCEEE
ncbi:MAG: Gfo/Idh/MocA family oxidoreductase [Spirochaetales bacterium]|nr:Gfo/Idh/MocA family oxidoreductase [Spirochaetales bacterium]